MADSSDLDLVTRFLESRSEEAFRDLYAAHSGYLYCLALRLTGGRASDSEEIVQEAWIRTIRRIERFQWKSALRTWMAGIVINCWRELNKRQQRIRRKLNGSSELLEEPRTRPHGVDERLDLERCLAALPAGLREVLILFDVQGFTHNEIAEWLDIAPGTSKSRLFEARKEMRRQLGAMSTSSGDEK